MEGAGRRPDMSSGDIFVFLGVYESENDALADYENVKELHRGGMLGTYDAAVITHDAHGQVHVSKDELPTRHGAWAGAAVGAVAGLIFPPSVLVAGALGAGVGALEEHFRRGMSRSDVEELGAYLGVGEVGLVVVADSKVSEILERELKRARTTIEKGMAATPELVEALEESSGAPTR
jgi:uncharacterized membrane protein